MTLVVLLLVGFYAAAAYYSAEIRSILALLAAIVVIVLLVPQRLAPYLRDSHTRGFYSGAVAVAALALFLMDHGRYAVVLFWTAVLVYWLATDWSAASSADAQDPPSPHT